MQKLKALLKPGGWVSMGLWLLLISGCASMPKQFPIEGIERDFAVDSIVAAASGDTIDFEDLVAELAGVHLIFIGEIHSSRRHHEIQEELIRALHRRRPLLKVGLEMFDRSYQAVLDLWGQGALDEQAFIKRTHWYSNWRFDFNLYRGIMMLLKEERMPLVGLDLPTYIHSRIRAGGIENLSAADRKWLPREVPPGDDEHRLFLKKTFEQHKFLARNTDFDDFYAAQCARDATMARTIADHLGAGSMVILAGNGHIRKGSGVPQRAAAYSGEAFRTVYLAPVDGQVPLDIADYIWITPGVAAHPGRR